MPRLALFRCSKQWRRCEREHDNLFSGRRADVVVQTDDGDADNPADHRLQCRTGNFDQVRSDLLKQITPFLRSERFDKMLLSRSQYADEPDDQKITKQIGMDVLRTPAHVFLLEAAHALSDSAFNLSLCLHCCFQHSRGSDIVLA